MIMRRQFLIKAPLGVLAVANRVLDSIGVATSIGDLQEGSREAQVLLRHYGAALRQLSRSAHWNALRRQAQLVLLNDASGQTTQWQQQQGVAVTVGTGTVGMRPWIFEYKWPTDCVKARFVPATDCYNGGTPAGNIALPSNPLMSGLGTQYYRQQVPTRFVVTNDVVPNVTGAPTSWASVPDTSQTMGQGLTSQTVVLSNQRFATLVYTALITYPDQWDPLFQEAFVALLASRVALVLVTDRKAALEVRKEQVAICKSALDQARVSDGNEGWFSNDLNPDWLRIRTTGGRGWDRGGGGPELGVLSYGWDTCGFSDGSAY